MQRLAGALRLRTSVARVIAPSLRPRLLALHVTTPARGCAAVAVAAGGTAIALNFSKFAALSAVCEAGPPRRLKRTLSAKQHAASSAGLLIKDGRADYGLIGKLLWRFVELLFCLAPVAAFYCLHKTPLIGRLLWSRERLLDLLVRSLAHCGPVGIKWGQWASTRYDLFEEDFCTALNTLTNHAPAHDFAHTKACVERSFERTIEELFAEFDATPLASGSIGQVHLGILAATGAKVAIKVQHPDLAVRLFLDMTILRRAADLAAALAPGMRVGETVDQFASNFECQLDFRDEADNLRQFRDNFGGAFWSALVSFPQPIEGLVSHDVLVETFEEGESVAAFLMQKGERKAGKWVVVPDPSSAYGTKWTMVGAGEDDSSDLRCKVAVVGLQAYLKMLIWDNLIHADLHPGNVLIRMETVGPLARLQRYFVLGDASAVVPHVVFLDAGLAATFNPLIYTNVRKFFDAIVADDGVAYAESILGLGASQPYVADQQAFIDEVNGLVKRHRDEYNAGGGRSGDNIRDYMTSVRNHRVVLDPTVMVALMSMLVLEGWQNRLDPAVSVLQSVEQASTGGVFGYASRLKDAVQGVKKRVMSVLGG